MPTPLAPSDPSSTSTSALHTSLLRPPIIHILRAAGFTTARPSVLDTVVDLASRYMMLLGERTKVHVESHAGGGWAGGWEGLEGWEGRDGGGRNSGGENTLPPGGVTITDVRLALQDAGALWPAVSEAEEPVTGHEDLRGVEAFTGWCVSREAGEIRRVAGVGSAPPKDLGVGAAAVKTGVGGVVNGGASIGAPGVGAERKEDFLAQLKRKNFKGVGVVDALEESRYAGTVLGREMEGREVRVEGLEGVESVGEWGRWVRERLRRERGGGGLGGGEGEDGEGGPAGVDGVGGGGSESSGSPLTEISASTPAG